MDEERETFEAYTSNSSIEPTSAHEGTNAARFALMAQLGSVPRGVVESATTAPSPEDLARFGLNPELAFRAFGIAPAERAYREAEFMIANYGSRWEPTSVRALAFAALNTDARGEARVALLAAGLNSALERESVTAATAILTSVPQPDPPPSTMGWRGWPRRLVDRQLDSLGFGGPLLDFVAAPDEDGEPAAAIAWDGEGWQAYCSYWLRDVLGDADAVALLAALRFLAQVRVDIGQRSADPIVRELAFASYLNQSDDGSPPPPIPPLLPPPRSSGVTTELVSTMVHGTWGWKGTWWYPGGDFHTFIDAGIRPSLYDGGQEFSWSGAYSNPQRAIGGTRFARWAHAASGSTGLGTVFAHSYGAEIVARAVNAGSKIDEVVFLSAPVHSHHLHMLSRVRRVIDVRLSFDIVLMVARAAQRLPAAANVVPYVVKRNFWSHAATHNPTVWATEGIAAAVGL